MGRFVMEPNKSENGCFISVFATLLFLKCKTWLELYFFHLFLIFPIQLLHYKTPCVIFAKTTIQICVMIKNISKIGLSSPREYSVSLVGGDSNIHGLD